jgi:hypothetical protein
MHEDLGVTELICLRWFVSKPGAGVRGLHEIVTRSCIPIVDQLAAADRVESVYVSKHPDAVWLTLFTRSHLFVELISSVEAHLSCYSFRSDHVADPNREEMLRDNCVLFRRCLDRMTRIALDIHRSPSLDEHQGELIRVGKQGRLDRASLQHYLQPRSATFQGLQDPEQFWSQLGCNCLSSQTDCVHWLYNVVLGFDWNWELPEAVIREQVGLGRVVVDERTA